MCECPPTRGERINRRAFCGSQIKFLRERIAEMEKRSRKTPARTMHRERAEVETAKLILPGLRVTLDAYQTEYDQLRATEHQCAEQEKK